MKRLPRQTCPPRELEEESWLQLLVLAYTDRAKAYEKYADNFLSTNRQVYESDTRQLGPYLPDYAASIAQMGGASSKSSLLISELYVLRAELPHFLADTPWDLRASGAVVIYGTVRLIEKDTEIGTGSALFSPVEQADQSRIASHSNVLLWRRDTVTRSGISGCNVSDKKWMHAVCGGADGTRFKVISDGVQDFFLT